MDSVTQSGEARDKTARDASRYEKLDVLFRAIPNSDCGAVKVIGHLWRRGDESWPSIDHIANSVGMSRRAVIDAIDRLRGYGLITTERRYKQSSVFRIIYPVCGEGNRTADASTHYSSVKLDAFCGEAGRISAVKRHGTVNETESKRKETTNVVKGNETIDERTETARAEIVSQLVSQRVGENDAKNFVRVYALDDIRAWLDSGALLKQTNPAAFLTSAFRGRWTPPQPGAIKRRPRTAADLGYKVLN